MGLLWREHMGEVLCLVLLGATGVALLVGAAALPDPMFDPLGPAGLPRYIAYLLLALVAVRLVLLFQESANSTDVESEPAAEAPRKGNLLGAGERGIPRADYVDAPQIVRFALVTIITLVYLVALTVGGFSFTWLTLVFLAALGTSMSDITPRKLITVAAIAVIMSFALTYTFTDVLSVVLPD